MGTTTGKGRELADITVKRKEDILCVQEAMWKGSKAMVTNYSTTARMGG